MTVFDELASWYFFPSPTHEDSIPITEDEASEAEPIREEEIDTLEEILISFTLSGANEEQIDMSASDEDSPRWKPHQSMAKRKGKRCRSLATLKARRIGSNPTKP